MSRKTSVPSRRKPVRTWTSDAPRRTAWNVSSSVSTSRTGRPVARAMNASSGSYLACCLPPNAPPGSGAKTRTFDERQAEQVGDDALQPVRVLDRAPDRDPVAVGRGHERVRLDRELGDHREVRTCPRRRRSASAVGGVDVAPAVAVLAEDVRARRAGRRDGATGSWTSGASGASAGRDRVDRRAAPRTRPRRARRPPRRRRGVSAATAATGSPWYFVSPVASTGRSRRCGPKRGIGSGRSAAVMTSRTPGTASAAVVSIRPIRARATSSVTSFTWRASSRGRSATYCCSPVTRATAADAGCAAPRRSLRRHVRRPGRRDRSPTGGVAARAAACASPRRGGRARPR